MLVGESVVLAAVDWVVSLVDWLVGCLIGQLVGQLVGWSVGWFVRSFVGRLIGRLVGWSVGWLVGWLVAWLVGLLVCWFNMDWIERWPVKLQPTYHKTKLATNQPTEQVGQQLETKIQNANKPLDFT